jgi:catechol 1,2-dioxygenase
MVVSLAPDTFISRLHVPLTTQLYFKDDPNIPGDPWAGHKPQLVLNPRSDGKYLKADFDFVLNSGLGDFERSGKD